MKFRPAPALLVVTLLAAALTRVAPVALADGNAATAQRELRIERTLACPQCTDLPLDICTQDICNDMRGIIHQKVVSGESDAAIRQYFVDRYGSRVLLAPPKSSFSLLDWVLPFVVLLAGAAFTLTFIRRARLKPEYHLARDANGRARLLYRSRVERDVEAIE